MTDIREQLADVIGEAYGSCESNHDMADAILSRFGVVELPEPAGMDDGGPFWCWSNGVRMGLGIAFGDSTKPVFISVRGDATTTAAIELAAAIVAACRTAEQTEDSGHE